VTVRRVAASRRGPGSDPHAACVRTSLRDGDYAASRQHKGQDRACKSAAVEHVAAGRAATGATATERGWSATASAVESGLTKVRQRRWRRLPQWRLQMRAAEAPAATARVAVTSYMATCAAVSHDSHYSYCGRGVGGGGAGHSSGGRRVSTPAVVEDVPVANTAAATTPTTVPTAAAAGAAPSSVAARAAVPAAGIASPSLSSTLLALTITHQRHWCCCSLLARRRR
jgi:hypothetical protein